MSIVFEVGNSLTKVLNPSSKELSLVKGELRYRPEGYFFSKLYKRRIWDGFIKLYDSRKDQFQTGLLPRVERLFKEKNIPYKIQDKRVIPSKRFSLKRVGKFHNSRAYQKDCVNSFVNAHRGVINLPTGTGKTHICVEIIERLGVNTLYICPNTVIMRQTAEILSDCFGIEEVGMVFGGEKSIDKKIVVACLDSLPGFSKEVYDSFDLLIIDEFHHSSAETYQELNKAKFNGIYYRLGVTATHFRNDHSEIKMESILSDVLYTMPIKKAIKDGILEEPYFFIKEFNHIDVVSNYKKAYKAMIVENQNRNLMIKKFSDYCTKKDMSTLILVREINHGKILEKMIPNSFFIHGNHEHREEIIKNFKDQKIKLVISTNIIGEGADIPCLQAIIMAQALKAEGDIIQKIGRALRRFPTKNKAYIFDVKDNDKKHFTKQSNQRIKAYKKNYTNKIKIF